MQKWTVLLLAGWLLGSTACVSNKKVDALTRDFKAEIGALNEQLRSASQELAAMQLQLAERKGANDALLQSQDKYLARLDALEEELDQARNRAVDQQSSLSDLIKARDGRIQALEQKLQNIRDGLRAHQQTFEQLGQVIQDSLNRLVPGQFTLSFAGGTIVIGLAESLLFRPGVVNKLEPAGLRALAALAEVLNAAPRAALEVVGHTDNVAASRRSQDSWDFTALRAAAVVRALVNNFELASNRVRASGKGEFAPTASNETPAGQASNRRLELVVTFAEDQLLEQIKTWSGRN